jgi:hypothetical protein
MRKFIKLSILFSSLLLVLTLLFIELSEFIISQKADFKLNKNIKYIVIGHSHPECAFNDSLIDNFKNLAESGESYFYSYIKTKKVIEQNPSLEVIFIEFTNNQIKASMDKWIWNDNYLNYRYPRYSPFMDIPDKALLAMNNFDGFIAHSPLSAKQNLGRILARNFNYSDNIGGYMHLDRNKTDSLLKTAKKIIPINDYSLCENNLAYLNKIIKYCKENGKKVILIRSPQHQYYSGYSNESNYQKVRKERFDSIDYLDFSKFKLENKDFGDLDHLNYKGAKIFSVWFSSILEKGLIEAKEKETFIENEIQLQSLIK